MRSRFLTIGFTSSHDAIFLNEIAKAGTELGNFFYVDISQPNYPDKIQECLANSLEMAAVQEGGLMMEIKSNGMEFKQQINMERSYVVGDDEEIKIDENSLIEFTT